LDENGRESLITLRWQFEVRVCLLAPSDARRFDGWMDRTGSVFCAVMDQLH